MRKMVLWALIICMVSAVVQADLVSQPYITGDFNGWDPGAIAMTETAPESGIWTYTISGLSPGQYQQFKITPGDWSTTAPSANSWYNADATGQVTITFNSNVVSDGWLPAQYRVGVSTEPGSWSLVGDFNGWNNADPTQVMTSLGGGFYAITETFAAGTYNLKPTHTGMWDAVGTDGRSIDAKNYALSLASESEVTVYVDAFNGTMGIGNVPLSRDYLPHDPSPSNLQEDVPIDGLTLSWAVAQTISPADPNVSVADPNLLAHKLYMSDGSGTDPNLYYVATIAGWDTETLRASYLLSPEVKVINKDSMYQWRVDMVVNDSNDIPGFVWTFYTELTTPKITSGPNYQVVDAGGTAAFSVTVMSPSPVTYQWYEYVDGISDIMLSDGGDISGATTDTLSIANVELGDEGGYYCVVNNDSGVPATSKQALLGVKRRIAYWPFEGNNANSIIPGSPASYLYNAPAFVTTGIVGDAMEFDNDAGTEDILYTDPDQASYFDICNNNMTVACWIKSSFAATWGPMVARNGEDNGWQLRHNGDTLDRICFTTRGTGNDDGTASNRTVYDGNWHYAVGTYDGVIKKVYIDGIVSRVYSSDNGSIVSEGDAASKLVTASASPVSLAGRVRGDAINGLIFDENSVTPCILDEVEIYNYALDAAAIAQTYANVTGTAICADVQPYDLNSDCKVNLDDFTLLASEWLSDISVQPAP